MRTQTELTGPFEPSNTSSSSSSSSSSRGHDSHVENVGKMVEDMEGKMRNSLQEVYFSSESHHARCSAASVRFFETRRVTSRPKLTARFPSPTRSLARRNEGYYSNSTLVGRLWRAEQDEDAAGRVGGVAQREEAGCLTSVQVIVLSVCVSLVLLAFSQSQRAGEETGTTSEPLSAAVPRRWAARRAAPVVLVPQHDGQFCLVRPPRYSRRCICHVSVFLVCVYLSKLGAAMGHDA